MRTENCYTGIECEGPYQDKEFLFVPGGVSPEEFQQAWEKVKGKVIGIYYGAGSDSPLREDTLEYMRTRQHFGIFLIEFVDSEGGMRYVWDHSRQKLYYKTVHPHFVVWTKAGKSYFTWMNDNRFLTDEEVK